MKVCGRTSELHHIRNALLLTIILLAGLIVRVLQLPAESPWWDEIVSMQFIHAPSLVQFIQLERSVDPPMTPGYYVLQYAWAHLISPTVFSLRMLSVLLSLGCIPLMYLIGRRLFSTFAGLIAALAMALSLPQVYFAQEIRVYALVSFLALFSVYALLQALDTRKPHWWILHGCANAFLIFTHLFTLLLIAAEGLTLLVYYVRPFKRLLAWSLSHGLLILGLFLWLRTIDTSRIHDAASWMVPPGWREWCMAWLVFAGGRPMNFNPAGYLPAGISLDYCTGIVLFALIGWFLWTVIQRHRSLPHPLGFLIIWAVFPLLVQLTASYLWRPCFVYRYVLFSSFALYLLAGGALAALPSFRTRTIIAVLLLSIQLYQVSAIGSGPFRVDWQSAGAYLTANLKPQDKVIVFQCFNQVALLYNAPISEKQSACVEVWTELVPAIQEVHQQGGDVWMPVGLWTSPANIEQRLNAEKWPFTYQEFRGWPRLRIYHIPRL